METTLQIQSYESQGESTHSIHKTPLVIQQNTRTKKQLYGIGIELEGFLLDNDALPVALVRDPETSVLLPTTVYIKNRIREHLPKLAPYVSLEETSVMLEVKTNVYNNIEDAITSVMEIRYLVNKLLEDQGIRLVFIPIAKHPGKLVPATEDPSSRAMQLYKEWGRTSEGVNLLQSTKIAGLQINTSEPWMDENPLHSEIDIARALSNEWTKNAEALMSCNQNIKNVYGKTRYDILRFLMSHAKKERFLKRGYTVQDILLPPIFATNAEFLKWCAAHCDKDPENFIPSKDSKNVHSGTVKYKSSIDELTGKSYVCSEVRMFDSVNTEQEIADLYRVTKQTNDMALNKLLINQVSLNAAIRSSTQRQYT